MASRTPLGRRRRSDAGAVPLVKKEKEAEGLGRSLCGSELPIDFPSAPVFVRVSAANEGVKEVRADKEILLVMVCERTTETIIGTNNNDDSNWLYKCTHTSRCLNLMYLFIHAFNAQLFFFLRNP